MNFSVRAKSVQNSLDFLDWVSTLQKDRADYAVDIAKNGLITVSVPCENPSHIFEFWHNTITIKKRSDYSPE